MNYIIKTSEDKLAQEMGNTVYHKFNHKCLFSNPINVVYYPIKILLEIGDVILAFTATKFFFPEGLNSCLKTIFRYLVK